jgi:hypothetical protein
MSTNLLSSLSGKQLRQAAAIRDQIEALEQKLDQLLRDKSDRVRVETAPGVTDASTAKKRTMSPTARARIAAAQKRRWAKIKAARK